MKFLIPVFTLLLCFSVAIVFAQEREKRNENPKIGTFSGIILDNDTKLPVEFATISIHAKKDSSVTTGGVSNEKGVFSIKEIPAGRYFIKIGFMGYENYFRDSVNFTPQNPEMNLGKIFLRTSSKMLKDVVVVAEKELMQNSIDKKVFNVEKSGVTEGGTAADVLQNIPSVNVDADGNVALRGSGNVNILIDGKPSTLTGTSRAAILEQLPAGSIESIEVITNPSAKYDPEGMAGIINIVLKKNRAAGYNGSVLLSAGTRNKYTGNLTLNYRNKKWNLSTNYNYRYNEMFNVGTTNRTNFLGDSLSFLESHLRGDNISPSHFGKINADYNINEKNTVSLGIGYNTRTRSRTQNAFYYNLDKNHLLDTRNERTNLETEKSNTIDVNFGYRKTFVKPQQDLYFSALYSLNTENTNLAFLQKDFDKNDKLIAVQPLDQQNLRNGNQQNSVFQLDYVHPIKNGKLEMGAKTVLRKMDDDFFATSLNRDSNQWEENKILTNRFLYTDQVLSAYFIFAKNLNNWSLQAGLRGEQTYFQTSQFATQQNTNRDYFSLFPSVHLSNKISKNAEIQASYSRRINRPNSGALNPFTDFSDPFNLRSGNPLLNPEFINAYEISYLQNAENITFSAALFFRETTNLITRVTTSETATVLRTSFQNMNKAQSIGMDGSMQIDATKWWNLNINGSVFRTEIQGTNGDAQLNSANFSWTAKAISTMKLPWKMDFQIAYNYNGKNVTPQGYMIPMQNLDLSLKKDVLKGKGSLNLRVTDIFNTRQFGAFTSSTTFEQNFIRKRESRIATINFTYRFGAADKSGKGKGKKRETGSEGGDMDMGGL